MSLWDAWREWAAGNDTLDLVLWGLEIRWWGRIGKMLQFAGALTVILDIVGPQRLIAFGASLREAAPFRGMVTRVSRRWRPLWEWVRGLSGGVTAGQRERTAEQAARLRNASLRHLLPRVVLFVLGLVVALLFASWGWLLVLAVLLGGLALFALAALVSAAGSAAYYGLIRPFAALISIPAVDAWAKSVGIVLVAAGFHFDLLAS